MRRPLTLAGLGIAALLAVLWLTGGFDMLARLAAETQRSLQAPLAGAVRAVKAGQPAAWAYLISICFIYEIIHAAGPGHGKFLIGGYGVARRVPLLRLAGVAVSSSLAQAGAAVALVYAGVLALGWGRERMVGLAEGTLALASWGAIGAIGLWLVWRGGRRVAKAPDPHHHHHHDHGPDCGCGHAHAPSADAIAAATGWRDTLALIGGVALRPCSGAIFLLILTFQLGIGAAGVAGAFAMGLGVAVVTVAVAVLAVWSREGALAGLGEARIWRLLPWFEIAGGAVIAAFAAGMLLPLL